MTEPNNHPARSSSSAQLPASFVVRVWRTGREEEWRCHLIEVESGQHVVCQGLDELVAHIELWLYSVKEPTEGGLR